MTLRHEATEVPAAPLTAAQVACAGRFTVLDRSQVAALIRAAGGECLARLSSKATHLVVGQADWPIARNACLLRQVRRVQQSLREAPLVVYSEEALLDWLDPQPRQLAFQSVASDRRDRERLTSKRFRRSLQRLRIQFPRSATQMVDSLRREGRRLVAVLPDGRFVEPHGQLLFEFNEPDDGAVVLPWQSREQASTCKEVDRLDEAVDLEESGDLIAASELYREMVAADPLDALAWSNLGNVLYRLGELVESCEAYERSLVIDRENASAWNNCGVVLADLGKFHRARQCWRRSLEIDPSSELAAENLKSLSEQLS